MLISETYREQNRQLHALRPDFGARGYRWASEVAKWSRTFEAVSWLDVGCGKATLYDACGRPPNWQNYDPAVFEYEAPPRPADLVMCLDVLEHVEPDRIDDVLDDLRGLTLKACVMFVDTGPAHKNLPDGRNAHILQRPLRWWLDKIQDRFTIHTLLNERPEFLCIGTP